MKSVTIAPFRKLFAALPLDIQQKARMAFTHFKQDPFFPSLMFKEVNKKYCVWSARIDDTYRVLGYRRQDEMRWFWIGTHAGYDAILNHF